MITRNADTAIDAAFIADVLKEFREKRQPRLKWLKDYYDGNHAITERTKRAGQANFKITHDLPRYITATVSGYLLGKPVDYASNVQEKELAELKDVFAETDAADVDAELAVAASIYGIGICVLYIDEQARFRFAAIDPRAAFVVYDDSVAGKPMAGLYWRESAGGAGRADVRDIRLTVATESWTQEYIGKDYASLQPFGAPVTHYFGGVPIIEFWNNSDERGDFEGIISLIDAYDQLQSDRLNDKAQFADSLLVFTGVTLGTDADGYAEDDTRYAGARYAGTDEDGAGVDRGRGMTPGERLRIEKTLSLPDKDAKVEWLTKALNETDTQVLADSLSEQIHKLAMVPDLSDEKFAGNSSGVAIRYKLMGLESLTRIKERGFREGLRQRLRGYAHYMELKNGTRLDADKVNIQFSVNLPINEYELSQTLNNLRGLVPEEVLLGQVPFVEDVAAAASAMAAQKRENARVIADGFGTFDGVSQQ